MRTFFFIVLAVLFSKNASAQQGATAIVAATIIQGVGAQEVMPGHPPLVSSIPVASVASRFIPILLPAGSTLLQTTFGIIGNQTVYTMDLYWPAAINLVLRRKSKYMADVRKKPFASLTPRDVFEMAVHGPTGVDNVSLPEPGQMPELMIHFN